VYSVVFARLAGSAIGFTQLRDGSVIIADDFRIAAWVVFLPSSMWGLWPVVTYLGTSVSACLPMEPGSEVSADDDNLRGSRCGAQPSSQHKGKNPEPPEISALLLATGSTLRRSGRSINSERSARSRQKGERMPTAARQCGRSGAPSPTEIATWGTDRTENRDKGSSRTGESPGLPQGHAPEDAHNCCNRTRT
jgi:hypothetical protein